MIDDPNSYGPHWDANLFGPTGKLTRLHKGASPPPAVKPPPPVRETSRDVQQKRLDEVTAAGNRKGYQWSLLGGSAVMENQTGKKSLLGQ